MPPKRRPSAKGFVVRGVGVPALRRRCRGQDGFEALEALDDDTVVLRVTTDAAAKPAWRRVQDMVGDGTAVMPVLIDDEGSEHYPTGAVQVRFHRELSDAQLAEFAATHELSLVSRNEYQPQQARFEPTGDRYLPDVIAELNDAERVQRAWEESKARYSKH